MVDLKEMKKEIIEQIRSNNDSGECVVAKAFADWMIPRWVAAPEDFTCPDCGAALERLHVNMGGPWSGSVRCTKCDFRDTVCSYLGKKCIAVTPMEDPAKK